MKKFLMGLTFMVFALVGCAGTSDDPEALDNALVAFTSCVQSSRWQEALEYVTPDEANQISSDGYDFKQEYQLAARRLPLSTLRKAGLRVDGRGEEQAKVGTNLEEMEKEHIKRRLEEGQKILKEEEEEANQEQQVEVLSNKLTDEEKRKYGSTRDLQAPEEFRDENIEEAEEKIFNGDYESND